MEKKRYWIGIDWGTEPSTTVIWCRQCFSDAENCKCETRQVTSQQKPSVGRETEKK